MQKLKLNQLNILKLNNNFYIPFQPHNIPKNFEEIPLRNIIKFKSFTYININSLEKPLQYYKENITFNKNLNSNLIHH